MTMPSIAELKPGDVWILDHPVRIARVNKVTSINYIDKITHQPASKPSVEVDIAIITQAIEGHISEDAARSGRIITQALMGGTEPPGKSTEIWAERAIHPVAMLGNTRAAYVNDGAPMIPQTYVESESGRHPKTQSQSSVTGSVVRGVKLDTEPPRIFKPFDEGLKSGDVNPAMQGDFTREQLGNMNILKLRVMAKARGIDISGISGPGSKAQIVEKLVVVESVTA